MREIKRILCATDFSEPADKAIEYGRMLAQRMGADLTLLHVVEPVTSVPAPRASIDGPAVVEGLDELNDARHEEARSHLQDLARRHAVPDMQIDTRITTGKPGDEIVAHSDTADVDLVVIATHGHSPWRKFLFGSVADRVVRSAACPVLTVNADVPE